jgi:hypothetical protein
MAGPKSRLPERRKPVRPPAIVRQVLAGASAGTGGVAGTVYLAFARHVPFSAQAGIFADIVAVIVLIALIGVAIIVLTVSLDQAARSRLRYQAGKQAIATAKSNDEALQTYRALHASLSWRWLRWLLGLPDDHDEGEEDEDEGGEAG